MAITEKMYLYNDILLDNKTALRTISSQLTAHSSQLTKLNSNQNNILFYNTKSFIEKSSLGISLRFVRIANSPMTALFLCP